MCWKVIALILIQILLTLAIQTFEMLLFLNV